MYTLSTSIELPIAHRLPEAYSGLCVGNVDIYNNKLPLPNDLGIVHGHNYIITVSLKVPDVAADFMVIDFKQIKKIIHEFFDKFDHSLILKAGDKLIDFYVNNFKSCDINVADTRLFIWDNPPTAEYMAYKWYHEFMEVLIDNNIYVNNLVITVEETSHNKVAYTEE